MIQSGPPSLTSNEMAVAWRVTADTAVRWAQQGRAEATRTPGGHWRFFGPLPVPSPGAPSPSPDGTEGHTDEH